MNNEKVEENEKTTYDLSKVEPYYVNEDKVDVTTVKEEEQNEENLSTKAKRAADSFRDLVTSATHKAKDVTAQKTKEIASVKDVDLSSMAAAKDARDISTLGPMVEELAKHFEGTMTEIEKQSYNEQTELLIGYKKLLEEQVKVIDARMHYVKRI